MGRGGKKLEKPGHVYPWSEIQKHSSKEDRWIVIGGQVYDVTEWSKRHPGGQRLIGHYAGQDATDAFNAFHNEMGIVKKYLKPIHVGSVEDYVDSEINKDFRQLKQTAIKMGFFEPSHTFFTLIILHVLALQALSYFVLVWFGVSLWTLTLSVALYSTAQTQAGWTQHDFGHLSVFKKSRFDHILHHFMMTFIKGASASWWNHMHYQHHAKPNVINKDPDVRIDALFVVGDVMPIDVAKTRKKSMPYNRQHSYFLASAPLLFPIYFQYSTFHYMFSRKLWGELAICMLHYIIYFYLFSSLLGFGVTLLTYFIMRIIESTWFTWVAQSNHIPMNIKNDESNPWLKLQMNATCDIEKSFFNDWFTGHLNFQIEHHLFPTMPRHNLYKVAPLVKSLCEKHQVPYVTKGLLQAFVDIVKSLKHSGKLWEMTYKEFHCD